MVDPLVGALVGHCVGDYILQNDWMAKNKKLRFWPCFVHAMIYTCSVMFFSGWMLSHDWLPILFAVLIPHYLIDRSKFVGWYMWVFHQDDFAKPPLAPWSTIAVDNSFHFVCLWIVASVFEAPCQECVGFLDILF